MTPIASIPRDGQKLNGSRNLASVHTAMERERAEDPNYAIPLLVDTAILALSQAVNDPTTAVKVLDYMEPLSRRLGNYSLNTGMVRDSSGAIRFICETPSWENCSQLALIETMRYGGDLIQVQRRLQARAASLEESDPSECVGAIGQSIKQRQSIAGEGTRNATLHAWADRPDRMGIVDGRQLGSPITNMLRKSESRKKR